MKKEFVQHFKPKGFRINTKKGEAFKKVSDLHFFLRLFEDDDFEGNPSLYFKFGVVINSPFDATITPFENSVYLGEFCYGGERTDFWTIDAFDDLISKADCIGLSWIDEYMDLELLANHILWRIENGLRWLEPPQFKSDSGKLSTAGQAIVDLSGGPGDKICFDWVKRFYKPLAIVHNVKGDSKKALEYMNLYLEHIARESFRGPEIDAIQRCLSDRSWPSS